MKITRTGWVLRSDIVKHSEADDRVFVSWEESLPTIDMAQALSIVARGGQVQRVTDSDGENVSEANCMCPDEDGWIELRPDCRYVEVSTTPSPEQAAMTPEQAATRLGLVGGDLF